ncbi:MAG: hypothetical protein M3404_05655 [Actinomycetota bacterium]|nr:hypothetical protein [Actinomycetota bacterium]
MSTPSSPQGGWQQPGGWQPPAGTPPPPPSQGYPPPPPYGYGPPPPQTEGTAITALVLSISSFMICPVIPAVVALVLCSSARRKIEESGGALTGEGLVTAARIVSWVNIGLCGAAIVLFVIVLVIGAIVSDSSDEFSLVLNLMA